MAGEKVRGRAKTKELGEGLLVRSTSCLMKVLLDPTGDPRKIIGGRVTEPHSHPYMAYLQFQTTMGIRHCGGFLVREDFVLTAAHCWGRSINVTLGAHNIKEKERTQQIISERKAIPHPYFNSKLSNDIMLLQVRMTTSLVNLIKLPSGDSQLTPGMVCTVAGWGLLDLNQHTTKLHEVQLEIQKDKECLNHFRKSFNSTIQICVGNPKEKNNSFLVNSGGPFVCNNVAQGIVSFGSESGTPPSVYTRISVFRLWIKKIMRSVKLNG
uniref:Peptidase S1 domain-containing protein n=1 Tax=Sciurus vulgaris TaxID=55149 RepID=A0A8D2CM20_SCIVU